MTKEQPVTAGEALQDPNILIAVYGTLRKDQRLYELYIAPEPHEYVDTVTIEGFKLWSTGSYPVAEPTGDPYDTVVADLFKVTPASYDAIYSIEHSAGYTVVPVETGYGHALMFTNTPGDPIPSGDWVKYREEREKQRQAAYEAAIRKLRQN